MKYTKLFEQWAESIVKPFVERLTEDNIESVGREFQHIEDLVYIYGIEGARRAIERLETIATNSEHMEVKWDGCVDPDLILESSHGKITMEQIIDLHQSGESIQVLAFDLETNSDVMVNVELSTKRHGIKKWVEILLENGDILKMTGDHEVYTTNRGWVAAQDLTADDDIKESESKKYNDDLPE
jgi:hypothetical protein